jgi:hypothetical protein
MLAAFSGCSKGDGQGSAIVATAPVSGTLTSGGKALEHFQVSLHPIDGGRGAVGRTDAAGKFTLGTNGTADGAPLGKSKVTVVWVGPPVTFEPGHEPSNYVLPPPPVKLPKNLADPVNTTLEVDVPKEGLADFKVEL